MIEVALEDGTVIEFPDGISEQEIQRAISDHQSNPAIPNTPGLYGRAMQMAKDTVSPYINQASEAVNNLMPKSENYPEMGFNYQNVSPEQALAMVRDRGDKSAIMGEDRYGNPLLLTKDGPMYVDSPNVNWRDIGGLPSTANYLAENVAPYMMGGAATAGMRALPAALSQAPVTGYVEANMQAARGEDFNPTKIGQAVAFGAAGELSARLGSHVFGGLFNKIFGKKLSQGQIVDDTGQLTDKATKMIEDAGLTDQWGDLVESQTKFLTKKGVMNAEEAERFNFLNRTQGGALKAEVTQSVDDFQAQQELLKTSNALTDKAVELNQNIKRKFDLSIANTGGQAVRAEQPIVSHIQNRSLRLEEEIGDLYDIAREVAPGAKNVRFTNTAEALRKNAASDDISKGLIKAIRGNLQERGVLKGFKPQGKIDVETAEDIRIYVNRLSKSSSKEGQHIASEIKDAIDDDVINVAGRDYFKQARDLKHTYEKDLTRVKKNRFDARKSELVRAIRDNQIDEDRFLDQIVLAKAKRKEDLVDLKRYLNTGNLDDQAAGQQAWRDLQAETLEYLKDKAFSVGKDKAGYGRFSATQLEKAIDRIGEKKLEVIFEKDMGFIKDMRRLAALKRPIDNTQQGLGPTGQGVMKAYDRLTRESESDGLFSGIAKSFLKHFQASKMIAKPDKTADAVRKALDAERQLRFQQMISPIGAPLGVGVSGQFGPPKP